MSVYRKESNSLVPKAGLGIIDNIFNRFSNHAISNAKTTEALILRNVMYDESDGKLYIVGIDGVKGEEIKMGMPILDYANPLFTFDSTHLTYTATKECYLFGQFTSAPGIVDKHLLINNTKIAGTTNASGVYIFPSIPMTKLKAGDVVETEAPQSGRLSVYDVVS